MCWNKSGLGSTGLSLGSCCPYHLGNHCSFWDQVSFFIKWMKLNAFFAVALLLIVGIVFVLMTLPFWAQVTMYLLGCTAGITFVNML
jgi:hypothetical protein